MTLLDPQQARIAKLLDYLPAIHTLPPFMARISYTSLDRILGIPKIKVKEVRDYKISNYDNQGKIKLRVYYPTQVKPKNQKALIYFHGGGCVIGSINSHDRLCRKLCEDSQTSIISVEYRLAPKYKFPTAILDAIHAWNWISQHLDDLGLTDHKLGAGGDSAGGYLAFLLSIPQSQTELDISPIISPKFLYLLYPMMDLRGLTQSYKNANQGVLLTNTLMDYFSKHYLNNEAQKELPLASPLLFSDLSPLPETYILTCGHDPLCDDGITLVEHLNSQNIPVKHDHLEDCMHSFVSVYRMSRRAQQATQLISKRLQEIALL